VAEQDRVRWDSRYSEDGPTDLGNLGLPAVFSPHEGEFPTAGVALDLACGQGTTSVWLAIRGLDVCGVDVSAVALERARQLAATHEVSGRCRFLLADLDLGLPPGPPADVVLCHLFRDPRLYRPLIERVKGGGLVAIAVLSEVGAQPGPFRACAGELQTAFDELAVISAGESEGRAWLLARKGPTSPQPLPPTCLS
jgi:SAM-dependent methyltransferase